jgi:5-methylcytosine-specific restriction endonuclease McrA
MAEPQYRWPPGLRDRIFTRDTRHCSTFDESFPHCRIELPGVCTHRATAIDHIIDAGAGGAWFDPDNLRAACFDCNQAKRNKSSGTPTPTHREFW